MKKRYDFSKSVRNPYLRKPKKQLTIRLDEDTISYFKSLAEKNGIPYQNLINLYLRECAESGKTFTMKWSIQGLKTRIRLSYPSGTGGQPFSSRMRIRARRRDGGEQLESGLTK